MDKKTDALRAALTLLEEALGSDLIRKEVHKMHSWNPEGSPGLHPLVLLWYKTKEDLGVAELTGNLPHSRWVEETLELGSQLEKSRRSLKYQEILDKLINTKPKDV